MKIKFYSKEINLFIFFVFISALSTLFNYPLARFPGQDLLWNDLVLACRVLWAKDAICSNPFASIDFLQGLGDNVIYNVKVLPHFFDPAVFFSLFLDISLALGLRNFILILYCLCCLELIWKQQVFNKEASSPSEGLKIPLFVFYVLSPQLFGDASHHFSSVYYAIPGVILSLRYFLKKKSILACLAFVGASTLYINISDLHILFLAETLALFILLFDPLIGKMAKANIAVAAGGFYTILLLSYLGSFNIFFGGKDLVVNKGSWELQYYIDHFLIRARESLFFPFFSGPVTAYISPFLPIFILILLWFNASTNRILLKNLLLLFLLIAGLFLLGVFMHGWEPTRVNLPSAFRYHISIIPFLAILWIIFHVKEIAELIYNKFNTNLKKISYAVGFFFFFSLITLHWFSPKTDAFIVLFGKELNITQEAIKKIILVCLTLYPFLLIFSIIINQKFKFRLITGYCLVIVVLLTYNSIRSYGVSNPDYVDFNMKRELYNNLFAKVNNFISGSKYADLPRSFIPISKAFVASYPGRGINDKMLPWIELPEEIGGRSFFHWRYSHSRHTSTLYADIAKAGSICVFPPVPEFLNSVISFAKNTDSPFIISADTLFSDQRLELLGSHSIKNNIINKYTNHHYGLIGDIYLYALKEISSNSYSDIKYSRVSIVFHGLNSNAQLIKLPITYYENLKASDSNNKNLPVIAGEDGFAYIANNGNINYVKVSSFSWITIISLLSPVFGFLIMIGLLFIRRSFGFH